MLGPLIWMPAAHRRDPLALGHALAPGSKRFLDLADGRRVLENGVVARPVGEADDMDVTFDEAGHNRAASEVDDLQTRGRIATHSCDPAVADRD